MLLVEVFLDKLTIRGLTAAIFNWLVILEFTPTSIELIATHFKFEFNLLKLMLTPAERFLKRKGPPVMSRAEDGYNEITHEYLVKLCEWND